MRTVTYGETEHYTLTRDFLANPQRYLRHLMGDL
jgi:predicted ATPase